ncbi:heavy metal translocating P-type ATPase [Candidatus Methylospira mobilis]|uniref:heavy metal translocating P-type ATPase n=1 Tax=Candidatus Methylospira mobilis TaxID=1808979 RepID=UPI0028E9737D|nr:heavy metal translocating P-type ATPase [Candidatus Methylospira mobilis]WNV04708.1 heavy metal translocating P-type ATPase [Candidatus Methylospira mobilis]
MNKGGEMRQTENCKVVHQTRRRVRILAPGLTKKPDYSYLFEILLRKHAAIKQVRLVPDIGSVAVHFDPELLPSASLMTLLDDVLGSLESAMQNQPVAARGTASGDELEREFNIALEGMSCASCALLIETHLRRDPQIVFAKVNYATETAQVRARMTREDLYLRIRGLGYGAHSLDSLLQRRMQLEREHTHLSSAWKHCLWASVLSAPSMILGMIAPHSLALGLVQFALAVPVVFWSGRSFFEKAWKLARQGSANMDSLVAMGVGSAFGYSLIALLIGRREYYFEAAAGIVTFVLMGRYLDEKARGQAHEAIRQLIDLQPQTATVLINGEEVVTPIDDVRVGDLLLVRPGERIPADGEVEFGLSTVDESMLTGESMPVVKEPGAAVTGGCINGNGSLQVRVKAVGPDSVLAGIVNLVDQAQSSRLPIQKTVDRVSAVFVPSVMVISALTFFGWLLAGASPARAFGNAITVLLIACPCALGLATPAAIMVGTGQAARRGIFIRNGESLEMASKITVMVFDKTGTITEGKPRLTDLINLSSLSGDEILTFAAAAELHSEHFLGKAIVSHARERGLTLNEPDSFQSEPGHGIEAIIGLSKVLIGNRVWLQQHDIDLGELDADAQRLGNQGKTPVFMALDNKPAAIIGIADQARANARDAITALRNARVRTLMVTGDMEAAARHIAGLVGIDEVIAHARPEQKQEIVRELQARGEKVGMIGDGVNDAPALAAADVSLAIGGGTDIAVQTADLTLINGDISKVAEAMQLSSFTLRVIHQNLFWAFGYNIVAIPVAAMGRLNPMVASLAMAMSSLSVVLNSLRLQKKD